MTSPFDVHQQRCGLIKLGTGYRGMNAFERERVAAAVHKDKQCRGKQSASSAEPGALT